MTIENSLPAWAIGPKNAIDGAIHHYFENLVTSPRLENEIMVLSQLIETIEPWLFMTEPSLENIRKLITTDIANVNLFFTLTTLFDIRFNTMNPQTLYDYNHRLAMAFSSPGSGDMSTVPTEYSNRIQDVETMINLFGSNRHLVMLGTMILFFDTNILAAALPAK